MNRALPQEVLDQIELEHQHFAAAPQAFFEAWKRGVNIAGAEWFGDGTRDGLFLSNFATINLLDTLRRVPGVGNASLFGALDYSMRVWLNMERLASLNITPDDVVKAVQAQNVQAAVGLVGAAPLMNDVDFQLNITTQGRLTTVEEFENIVVRAQADGALVRIKDVARVELGAKNSDSVGRYNGQPASGIQIFQLPGANALATAEGVRKAMKELEPRFPDDVAYDVMYDTTVFVKATIESVVHTLIVGENLEQLARRGRLLAEPLLERQRQRLVDVLLQHRVQQRQQARQLAVARQRGDQQRRQLVRPQPRRRPAQRRLDLREPPRQRLDHHRSLADARFDLHRHRLFFPLTQINRQSTEPRTIRQI